MEESVNQFRVIMSVRPAVILNRPKTFKNDWYEVHFDNVKHPEMDAYSGLAVFVTINVSDIDTAITRTRGLVNRLLSIFSFLSSVSLPEVIIEKAYDVTPEKTIGRFVQNSYFHMDTKSVRPINDEDLKVVTDSLSKLGEDENNSVLRAMHWYRHALQSRESLERFTFLWIGLETLNPILREYYGLEVEYSKCDKCGHISTPTLNGVKQLLDEIENQDNQSSWRKMRSLRAGILHGFRALKDTVPFTKDQIPVLERALGKGLAQITGFEEYDRMNTLDLTHPQPAYYCTQATIQGPDLQKIDKNKIPSFEISLQNFKFEKKGQSHEFKATPRIDPEFSFSNVVHALRCLEQCATSVEFKEIADS